MPCASHSRREITTMTLKGIILNTIKKRAALSILLLIIIGASIIFTLLPPLVLEQIVNSLADERSVSIWLAAAYFAAIAISGILDSGKEVMITILGQGVTHSIRSAMSRKLKVLPSSYYIDNEPGSTSSRFVNDVDAVDQLFASGIISMAADLVRLFSILFVIFTKSVGLGIMLVTASPLLFAMTRAFQKRMLRAQLDGRAAIARTNQQIPETIANRRTIRLLRQENYMLSRYMKSINAGYAAQERSNRYDSIYSPVIKSVSALIIGLIMVACTMGGSFQTFFGMTAGAAAALIAYVSDFFTPLENIGMEIQNIQSAIAGVTRINEFLKEPEISTKPTYNEAQDTSSIVISNLDFRYKDDEAQIFHDYSLTVNEGEAVTLAGRTGAGKSTLIKLIAGMYSPDKGSISIFGMAPDRVPEDKRRTLFGYVEQQFHMIPGTVADQITLHDPHVTTEQINAALMLVGLYDVAAALPDGIDTPCTQEIFSQGQFQLLSIARAVVMNPRLLLLDEITANLDSATEHQVLEALDAAAANRTIISISHRLYESTKNTNARIEYIS